MHFRHVCLESAGYVLPEEIVSSSQIEDQLAPVYERLHLPAGRLELMTGIQERRFFPRGDKPGPISAVAAQVAIEASGIATEKFGALLHGSVCRDQMEPATANLVHHRSGLSNNCLVLDVSNACLGLLNGAVMLAQMIELGQIQAGVVVGSELGRGLVEGTVHALLHDETLTRKSIKPAFASLTIGSASAALVLCHEDISQHGTRFSGGTVLCDTAAHELCAGGVDGQAGGNNHLLMNTDSEALLNAGIQLAGKTWEQFREQQDYRAGQSLKAFTHQVGKAHRTLLLEKLELPLDCDFPVFDRFGNTGAVALPLSLAMGAEDNFVQSDDEVALLGIGSGLNSLMLGLKWNSLPVKSTVWNGQ